MVTHLFEDVTFGVRDVQAQEDGPIGRHLVVQDPASGQQWILPMAMDDARELGRKLRINPKAVGILSEVGRP